MSKPIVTSELSTFDKVQEDWGKLTKDLNSKQHSVFSMYNIVDDTKENFVVDLPFPLEKDFMIIKGTWTITMRRWEDVYTEEITDLTVGKLAKIFHNHNDGSHIFLEYMNVDKIEKTINLFGGS